MHGDNDWGRSVKQGLNQSSVLSICFWFFIPRSFLPQSSVPGKLCTDEQQEPGTELSSESMLSSCHKRWSGGGFRGEVWATNKDRLLFCIFIRTFNTSAHFKTIPVLSS